MNGSQTAKQAPAEPMHKVTFHILDPITKKGIDIVQELRGHADYIASHFHGNGIIVEAPNGNSTWYNPSSIVRMHFKRLAEKPVKTQTLMSSVPPKPDPVDNVEANYDLDAPVIPNSEEIPF